MEINSAASEKVCQTDLTTSYNTKKKSKQKPGNGNDDFLSLIGGWK